MNRIVGGYAVAMSMGGYCYGCPPPDDDAPDIPRRVQIVPSEVWASPGTSFRVHARLLDEQGNVYPDGAASLAWSPTGPLKVTPATGASVVVEVPTGGPFGSPSVVASLSGYESATLVVHTGATGLSPSTADVIRAQHDNGGPPSIALIDGPAAEPLNDSLFAFSGRGVLDFLDCGGVGNCGEVTLFSRTQRLVREPNVTWTSACDDVDLTDGPVVAGCTSANAIRIPAPPLRRVEVRYVVLASGAPSTSTTAPGTVPQTVEADVDFARKVLADSWTGLDLPRATGLSPAVLTTSVTVALGKPDPCMDQVDPVGVQLGVDPDPKMITVAYVEKVLALDGTEVTSARGFTCPWNSTYGTIAVVSWSLWAPTTLVHELGHALGPWQIYPWGHTEGQPGFNESNVLWDYEVDTKPAPRSVITLGQAFRLSLDKNAWFHRGVATTLPLCQFYFDAAAPDTPCPRLSRDVLRP